jgi:hypothetical protein
MIFLGIVGLIILIMVVMQGAATLAEWIEDKFSIELDIGLITSGSAIVLMALILQILWSLKIFR